MVFSHHGATVLLYNRIQIQIQLQFRIFQNNVAPKQFFIESSIMNKMKREKEGITDRIIGNTEDRQEQVMEQYLNAEENPMDIINYYIEMAKTGTTRKEQ